MNNIKILMSHNSVKVYLINIMLNSRAGENENLKFVICLQACLKIKI